MLDSLHLIMVAMITMVLVLVMTMVREIQPTTPWLATMSATLATTSFPALLSSEVGEGKKKRADDDLRARSRSIFQSVGDLCRSSTVILQSDEGLS